MSEQSNSGSKSPDLAEKIHYYYQTGRRIGGAKHTPGPWNWRKFGDNWALTKAHSGSLIVLDASREGRKVMLRVRDQKHCLMIPFDPNHPDARLMTAAPDLLDAAKHALDVLERPEDLDPQDAIDALSRAIAKATGEAQD